MGNRESRLATGYAPASIGNLGPGLDILGCAVAGRGDRVTAGFAHAPGITILEPGAPELPSDPARNAAGIAAGAVLDVFRARTGRDAPGITLGVRKGLPLSAGQGGSAASALAGAVAVDALLELRLGPHDLLAAALTAEERVAGRHLDNLAAAFYGGIVLVRSLDPIDVVQLSVPESLRVVFAQPAQRLRTADARRVLPATLDRALAMRQAAQVAAMVAALAAGDVALLARAMEDFVAEPARASLLPGFLAAKRAALDAGAIGASISGAGPTAFAFAHDDATGARVAAAMRSAYAAEGVACEAWVAEIDRRGAYATVADGAPESSANEESSSGSPEARR